MATYNSCWLVTITALVAVIVLASSAQHFYASGRYGKKSEVNLAGRSTTAFWGGSRYGRSNGRREGAVEVAPRNDRFFLGSRYGKRLDVSAEPLLQGEGNDVIGLEGESLSQVTCLYTGITNLYRCYNRKDNGSEEATATLIDN